MKRQRATLILLWVVILGIAVGIVALMPDALDAVATVLGLK